MSSSTSSTGLLPRFLLVAIVLLTAFGFWFFRQPTAQAVPMYSFPKGSTYEKEWRRVDSLAQIGQYRSALDATNAIYGKARTANNASQLVRALMYKVRFSNYVEENSEKKTILELEAELKTAKYPLKPMLHSMLAELYWHYYQQNRWQFSNRSITVDFKNDDLETWDLAKFAEKSISHYQASLAAPDSLMRTKVDVYEDVILHEESNWEEGRRMRPTLYDFLAHRAINFFSSEEVDLIRPADQFVLEDPAYFGSPKVFQAAKLDLKKDSFALKYYALLHYQRLSAFHVNDANKDALLDVELNRLKFVNANCVLPKKDSLYEEGLRYLAGNYPESPIAAEVLYELALLHQQYANKYNPQNGPAFKDELKVAVGICDNVLQKYPKTIGATNCDALKKQIAVKSVSFTLEETALINMPSRGLINWANLDKVYFRIAQLDEKIDERYEYREQKEIVNEYLKLPVVASWDLAVPNDKDYRSHNAEFKLPELKHGHYVVLASAEKSFSLDKNGIAFNRIWVSNISYVNRNRQDGSIEYLVLHRQTGVPLPNVAVQIWEQKYDYSDRGYHYRKAEKTITDKNGSISIAPANEWRNVLLEFTSNDDHLYSDGNYQYRPYKAETRWTSQTNFFLDRGIYRPGQTVYFKAILTEVNGEEHRIRKDVATTVTFYDVNGQKVSSLNLRSNKYGTVSGSFTAPSGVLNGSMRIGNETGSMAVQVEEYKRPRFETSFNAVKGAYRLNDEVRVEGRAMAFAGSSIDGAQVKYRVTRQAQFPDWWCWWRGYYPTSEETEIANGTVISNDTGGFVIPFTAFPDKTVPADGKPTFNYTIYADVTDITGETHSASTNVRVGYVSLEASVGVREYLEKSDTSAIAISVNNLAGEPEASAVAISVWKLNAPQANFRKRTWARPDKFIYTKEEWAKWFPDDPYDNEDDVNTWSKGQAVFTRNLNTGKDKSMHLDGMKKWSAGKYMIELATKDKYGQEVKDVQVFTLYGEQEKDPAITGPGWFIPIVTSGEPGQKASFLFGTAASDVTVLFEVEHLGKIIRRDVFKLNKEQRRIEVPIEEKHRGNFATHVIFTYHNRAYIYDQTISVPWTSRTLDISFETFRNKLLPGQAEEWKLKIKGPKGEKVAAELLAAMYDASLDEFKPNYWYFNIWKSYYGTMTWRNGVEGSVSSSLYADNTWNEYGQTDARSYDELNWFGYIYSYRYPYYGYWRGNVYAESGAVMVDEEKSMDMPREAAAPPPPGVLSGVVSVQDKNGDMAGSKSLENKPLQKIADTKDGDQTVASGEGKQADLNTVVARKNLNETAFFYPHLETDAEGSVIIKFTMPEALTRWKFMAFGHTEDLMYAQVSREVVTQKDLMVMPNAPRFFRENDKITFTAKVSNLSDKELSGTAQLLLFDALSMKPIDAAFGNTQAKVAFTVKKGQSAPLAWDLSIPEGVGAVTYRVVAAAGEFSDGEEAALPVLSNRMLVTETMPLPIRGGQSKTFRFEKLLSQSNGSSTLRNHRLTLEFTSNPAWYAVQALPYMMEYPYECAEQTFSRYYSNSIASHIANSSPKIRAVFDTWKNSQPDAFLSNLEKNQELKSALLEETPWVLDAKDESERKRRVGLLFDMNRMANEEERMIRQLSKIQSPNGGFPWFPGMPDDRYITQHIVCGMGHLDHLQIKAVRNDNRNWNMITKAVNYLDARILDDYNYLIRYKIDLNANNLSSIAVHYLYARSYFKDIPMNSSVKVAFDYYMSQSRKYWVPRDRYSQGMIALAMFRYDDKKTANAIMASLKDNALHNEELGMYWKDMNGGYYWYQAPIETQALMIEAFDEISNDQKSVDELRVWLLKNKQTNDWKTTKSTVEACYALLLRGTEWLATESDVEIIVGTQVIDPKKMDIKTEAGTGYFKTAWTGGDIKPNMGEVKVTKKGPTGVSWGAMYWQYFEQLDKITPHESPLKVSKKLFRERNTANGPVIEPITAETVLHPGDKIKVRIELRTDRDMEYVHMKDMRASGFEPVNVISQYKYQGGLGYYESTRDGATNFFFNWLPKGTYVFEYPLNVIHAGDFSNGITSVQCMYAPEFATHSEGIRVKVAK